MENKTKNDKLPYITVLVTTYNYGRFIEEAIDSVLAQDYPLDQVEILIVDDGSTDDTSERVKKYGSQIQYFHKPNGGQASALNYGFARARGEIVTFLDADDFFLPTKLRRIAEAFASDPALGMVYHRIEVWHMGDGKREDWHYVAVSGDLRREPQKFVSYLTPPTLAISFRMRLLQPLLPIPEEIRMVADCYIAALIPYQAPVLAIPDVLAIYRVHGKNAHFTVGSQESIANSKRKLQMWQTIIPLMSQWLADHGFTREFPPVKAMMYLWDIILEREEFGVKPPGRIKFFRHIIKKYRYQSPLMNWRLAFINYSDALGALIMGYGKYPDWIVKREAIVSWMRGRKQ